MHEPRRSTDRPKSDHSAAPPRADLSACRPAGTRTPPVDASRWSVWLIVSGVGGVMFGVAVVSLVLARMLTPSNPPRPGPAVVANAPRSIEAPPKEAGPALSAAAPAGPETLSVQPLRGPNLPIQSNPTRPAPVVNYSRVVPQPRPSAPKVEPAVKPPVSESPLADIEQRARLLPLPPWVEAESGSVELCRILVDSPEQCELGLRTVELLGSEPRLQLARNAEPPPGTRTWTVTSRTRNLDQFTLTPVATFTLTDQTLTFEWEAKAPAWSQPQGLKYCRLHVKAGSQETTCGLSLPVKAATAPLNLGPNPTLALEVPAGSPALPEHLRIDLELSFQGASARLNRLSPRQAEPFKIVIPSAAKHGDGRVELEFRVVAAPTDKGADYALTHRAFLYPTRLNEIPAPQSSFEAPKWEHVTQRIDQDARFKRILKNGFNRSDFARLEKFSEEQVFALRKQIGNSDGGREARIDVAAIGPSGNKSSGSTSGVTGKTGSNSGNSPFAMQRSMKDHQKEALEHSIEFGRWIEEMKRRFTEIEKHAELRYSVSLDVGGEIVVLSETDPAPGYRAPPAAFPKAEEPDPLGLNPRKR